MTTGRDATLQPMVSIVTVCLNAPPEAIRYTFASVVDQSYRAIEWTVVDGGSAPPTLEAIAGFSPHIDVLVSEPDDGIFDAMNKGVRLANGELVLFMNVGDRFADRDALARLVEAARVAPRHGFYYGDYVCVERSGARRLVRSTPLTRFGLFVDTVCHQAVLNRRILFERIGPFDPAFDPGAEQEWYLRALAAGYTARYVPAAVCDYQKEGDHNRDLERLYRARRARRLRHYGRLERVAFGLAGIAVRTVKRIRGRNFAVPVRLRLIACGLRPRSRAR